MIAGLGNPGPEYENTWHNLGFLLIDRLTLRGGRLKFRVQAEALVAQTNIGGEKVLLAKPQTYMNLSGNSVKQLLNTYCEGEPANLLVACDDVALPIGMIRVRATGSAGGQKGLKSIIERVGSMNFPRVRLGIKPDHPMNDLVDYVLSPIPRRRWEEVDEMIDRGADAIEMILASGTAAAMQAFNQRVTSEPGGTAESPESRPESKQGGALVK